MLPMKPVVNRAREGFIPCPFSTFGAEMRARP